MYCWWLSQINILVAILLIKYHRKNHHWSISKSRFHSWFDGVILLSPQDIAITTLIIKCSHERIIILKSGWRMIELVCILKCQIKDYDSMFVGYVAIMRWLSISNNTIINESCYHVLLWKESLPLTWNTKYSIYSRRDNDLFSLLESYRFDYGIICRKPKE